MRYTSINIIYFSQDATKVLRTGLINVFLLGFLFFAGSCSKGVDQHSIAETCVSKRDLKLNANEGKWYYHNEPYNGYAIEYHRNGAAAEKVGFYNGKRYGLAQQWFYNGVLGSEIHYYANKIDGYKRTWWPNGQISSEAYFENGVVMGIQKIWYINGQLARLTTVKDGKPAGLQQAWLKNGKIYANYEVKNDRIFGMKRSNLCYSLTEERIIDETVNNIDDSLVAGIVQ